MSTEKPKDFKHYVEVFVKPEELAIGNPFYHNELPPKGIPDQAKIDEYNAGNHDFTLFTKEIAPERFVTHHVPWHDKYRHIAKDPELSQRALSGEFENLMDDPVYGPAIRQYQKDHALKGGDGSGRYPKGSGAKGKSAHVIALMRKEMHEVPLIGLPRAQFLLPDGTVLRGKSGEIHTVAADSLGLSLENDVLRAGVLRVVVVGDRLEGFTIGSPITETQAEILQTYKKGPLFGAVMPLTPNRLGRHEWDEKEFEGKATADTIRHWVNGHFTELKAARDFCAVLKGGEGSGRYPKGSGPAQDAMVAKLTSDPTRIAPVDNLTETRFILPDGRRFGHRYETHYEATEAVGLKLDAVLKGGVIRWAGGAEIHHPITEAQAQTLFEASYEGRDTLRVDVYYGPREFNPIRGSSALHDDNKLFDGHFTADTIRHWVNEHFEREELAKAAIDCSFTTVLKGGKGSGRYPKGSGKSKSQAMEAGIHVVKGPFQIADLGGSRKFMMNTRTGDLIFGGFRSDDNDPLLGRSTHGEILQIAEIQRGVNSNYDEYVRGNISFFRDPPEISIYNSEESGEYLPGGKDDARSALFDASMIVLERFIQAGATKDTRIELQKDWSRGTLGEMFPSLFKKAACDYVSVLKGGPGSGRYPKGSGEKSQLSGKSAYTDNFSMRDVTWEGRRFMIHPSSLKVLVGQDPDQARSERELQPLDAPGWFSSHAEEFVSAQGKLGVPGKYDDYVKGWVYGPTDSGNPAVGESYNGEQPDGLIDFYSKYFKDPAEAFDAIAHAAEAFVKSGHATAKTRVKGLEGALGYGMVGKRTLGEAFPFLFEHRKAAGDFCWVLKGGFGSGRYPKGSGVKKITWNDKGSDAGIPDTFPDGTKHVSRGVTSEGTSKYPSHEVAARLVNGTATLDDVFSMIDVQSTGSSWWDFTSKEYFDSRDYASVEHTESLAAALGGRFDTPAEGVIGSIGVVMHGRVPKKVESSDWDASIAQTKALKIPLIMVEYNAGNGWKQIDAQGRHVTVGSKIALDCSSATAYNALQARTNKFVRILKRLGTGFNEAAHPRDAVGQFTFSGAGVGEGERSVRDLMNQRDVLDERINVAAGKNKYPRFAKAPPALVKAYNAIQARIDVQLDAGKGHAAALDREPPKQPDWKPRQLGEALEKVGAKPDKPASPLKDGKVKETHSGEVSGGVNVVVQVELEDGTKAVFKPEVGEAWKGAFANRDIPRYVTNTDLSLAEREAIAYEVDQLLGQDLVPDTVLREELENVDIGSMSSGDDSDGNQYDDDELQRMYDEYKEEHQESAYEAVGNEMAELESDALKEHVQDTESRAEEIEKMWNQVVEDHPIEEVYGSKTQLIAHPTLPMGSLLGFGRGEGEDQEVDPLAVIEKAKVDVSSSMSDKEKDAVMAILVEARLAGATKFGELDEDVVRERWDRDDWMENHADTEGKLLDKQFNSFTNWKEQHGYESNNDSGGGSGKRKNEDAPHPDGGSLQLFMEDLTRYGTAKTSELRKFAMLDYALGTMDRHGGNIMYQDDKPVAIDNGYSMPAAPTADGFTFRSEPVRLWIRQQDKIPEAKRAEMLKQMESVDWDAFVARHPAMDKDERDAFLGRIDNLKQALTTADGLYKLWKRQKMMGGGWS